MAAYASHLPLQTASFPIVPFVRASLYVGDLDGSVTESHLYDLFSKIGPLSSIKVCRDHATQLSLGYAFVNYYGAHDASRALNILNFTHINGKPIRIMYSHRDPSVWKSGHANIFIKNFDASIDQKSLFDTFSYYGNILSCKIVTDDTGRSKGYGYVQFQNEYAARRAIKELNGMVVNGKELYVGFFIRREQRVQTNGFMKFTNVYVKNLDESVTDDDLKDKFSSFGNITSAVIMKYENGNSRGFGFINFEKPDAAVAAVQRLNGETFKHRVLYVGRAQKKTERAAELKAKYEQKRNEWIEKLKDANLYIKNLVGTINDTKLEHMFSPFGSILSCKVMLDPQGQSRGFGFVQFSSPEEATLAINKMNLKFVGGKPLYVGVAQRKEERRARLQAHFAHLFAPESVMPAYQAAPPILFPHQMDFGNGSPIIVFPQPARYGYPQYLIPGIIRPDVAPDYMISYQLQRRGLIPQQLQQSHLLVIRN